MSLMPFNIRVEHRRAVKTPQPLDLKPMATQAQFMESDTGLLVIDSQIAYCSNLPTRYTWTPRLSGDVEPALARIEAARDWADAKGVPTFLVWGLYYNMKYDHRIPFEDPEFGLHRQRLSGHFELAGKSHENAFLSGVRKKGLPEFKPELPDRIRDYPKLRKFLLAGFNTSVCITQTGDGVLDNGYEVAALSDCMANAASGAWEAHERSLEDMRKKGMWVGTLEQYQRMYP